MKDEHFRLTIVKILDDIRGDNPSPSDEVLQANASLLYQRYLNRLTKLEQKVEELKKSEMWTCMDCSEASLALDQVLLQIAGMKLAE